MTGSETSRRSFLRMVGVGACASALARRGRCAEAPRRPNVVIILSDDQGWGDLRVSGNVNLATPNIDSLARDGATFERFFVCPVCSPTRAEMLTGRYHSRGGVHGTSTGAERLNLDEKTIGDTFKAAGYATAAFGKWHNGMQYPYHPNARGFDEYYGFCSGHWGQYFDPVLEHNGKIVRGKGFVIDDFTDHALSFIEQNKDKRLFCYLPYNTPHTPFQVPDRFYDRFKGKAIKMRHRDPNKEELQRTRSALALCENIDWNVGRVLGKLEKLGLAENTIVVYFSDNGPNTWRWNGGMKGKKGSTDEGGVRVPCFVRWPGRVKAGSKIPNIAGAIDLLPTLTDMAGISRVGDKPLDGISVKPLLMDAPVLWGDRMIFSHQRGKVSVRTQQYRLDAAGKLYDMTADPAQRRDITRKKPEVAAKLSEAVRKWTRDVQLKSRKDNRPFPVGYPEFPSAMLPARDGVAHGKVERSAKAPNCSFFRNWTSPADRITWDVEVATTGTYEAVIYYTCPAGDVGSTIELSFNGSRIQGKVADAHDPPLQGRRFERVPRGSESYVKDFRPLRLGVFRLARGRGALTLRALKVPGRGVMDVRMVILTLQMLTR